jgi:hypothetical protein
MVAQMTSWISKYWERLLFGFIGFALLPFSFWFLAQEQVTLATASFAMSFLCFIYSNVSRFKRFKGLGFEAELWEDKQKEAAELIDRLKNIVSIYTREVVLQKVTQGRWGNGPDWKSHWALYEELVSQHTAIGQKIDFSDLKRKMDSYFIFDIAMKFADQISNPIQTAISSASDKINKEFGSPITDADGYGKRLAQIHVVKPRLEDPFAIAKEGDLAAAVLKLATEAKTVLKRDFDLDVQFDQAVLTQLEELSSLRSRGPVVVTDALIELSRRN